MSTERQIAERFKEAMETRNINVFAPYLAEDATCDILPYTVGKKLTRAQWVSRMTGELTLVQSIKVDITNVIEHPLFIFFQANFDTTLPFGPFAQKIVFLFQFTQDASGALKIASATEYVDTLEVAELKAKLGAALQLPCDM